MDSSYDVSIFSKKYFYPSLEKKYKKNKKKIYLINLLTYYFILLEVNTHFSLVLFEFKLRMMAALLSLVESFSL